jgi:hypothetical protein
LTGRTSFFEKKEAKKLLLLPCCNLAWTGFGLRERQRVKVFWFFFSKKNPAFF